MSDPFRKVQAGEPLAIPAETFNTFIDMAIDWEGRQLGQRRESGAAIGQAGVYPIENASGEDRDCFQILGIDGPLFSPDESLAEFQNRVALKGVVPPSGLATDPGLDGRFSLSCIEMPRGVAGLHAAAFLRRVPSFEQAIILTARFSRCEAQFLDVASLF
jgi:hypothetical protein